MFVEKCKRVVMEERRGRRRAHRMAREMSRVIHNPIGALGRTVNTAAGEDMSPGAKVLLLLAGAGVIGGGIYYLVTKPAAAATPAAAPTTTVQAPTTVTTTTPSGSALTFTQVSACQFAQNVINERLADPTGDPTYLKAAYDGWAAQCTASGATPPPWPG
jgi:zona occludens toxin (predicted ATPase)